MVLALADHVCGDYYSSKRCRGRTCRVVAHPTVYSNSKDRESFNKSSFGHRYHCYVPIKLQRLSAQFTHQRDKELLEQ